MPQELAASVAAAAASATADDTALEVSRLRQCLECKESELEIMQGWLSKGEQAAKVSNAPTPVCMVLCALCLLSTG